MEVPFGRWRRRPGCAAPHAPAPLALALAALPLPLRPRVVASRGVFLSRLPLVFAARGLADFRVGVVFFARRLLSKLRFAAVASPLPASSRGLALILASCLALRRLPISPEPLRRARLGRRVSGGLKSSLTRRGSDSSECTRRRAGRHGAYSHRVRGPKGPAVAACLERRARPPARAGLLRGFRLSGGGGSEMEGPPPAPPAFGPQGGRGDRGLRPRSGRTD